MSSDRETDSLGRVQSLVRAFGMLDVLAECERGLTLAEISRHVGLPRSTAHRLLSTMGDLGYVSFDPESNRWAVGLQAFAVGNAFARNRDLCRLGRPVMHSLMLDAHETVNVAVSRAQGVYFVGQVQASGVRPTLAKPGLELPIHTTAVGKAMMANWHRDELDGFFRKRELRSKTANSITEPSSLVSQLDLVRKRGFAVDDQENAIGIRCVAAPVYNEDGLAVASISISGSIARIPDDRIHQLGSTLAQAAQRVTETIGGSLAA